MTHNDQRFTERVGAAVKRYGGQLLSSAKLGSGKLAIRAIAPQGDERVARVRVVDGYFCEVESGSVCTGNDLARRLTRTRTTRA